MKKNLAKRIVLGLLTGAVLMSSSVAWAADGKGYNLDVDQNNLGSETFATDSLAIGGSVTGKKYNDNGNGQVSSYGSERSVAIGLDSRVGFVSNTTRKDFTDGVALGYHAEVDGNGGTAIGSMTYASATNSTALGYYSKAGGTNSVALGYGSVASEDKSNVVSIGYGGTSGGTTNIGDGYIDVYVPNTRHIINITDVAVDDLDDSDYGSYAVNVNTLNAALENVQQSVDLNNYYTKSEADAKYVKIENDKISNAGNITFDVGDDETNVVTISEAGLTVGDTSTHIDGKGVYVGAHNFNDAKAAMNDNGEIKGVNGTFSGNVTAVNFVTSSGTNIGEKLGELDIKVQTNTNAIATKAEKTYVDDELTKKADKSALTQEVAERQAADLELKSQIDQIGSGAIAGINQRLEKTNAKINKVGAGAAALAALHPLDYDPDDKLTFSAGMGNYAGENAAALGAFYRPNEKFMVSLGGTMGNGENMVNLGLSIGLDKPSGFAKMSKRELIQEVNAVKAENEAMKDQLANADERIAKLEALVAQLVAK